MAVRHVSLLDTDRTRSLLDGYEKARLFSELPHLQVKGLATSYRLTDRDGHPYGVVTIHTAAGVVEEVYEVTPFGVHRATSTSGGN